MSRYHIPIVICMSAVTKVVLVYQIAVVIYVLHVAIVTCVSHIAKVFCMVLIAKVIYVLHVAIVSVAHSYSDLRVARSRSYSKCCS